MCSTHVSKLGGEGGGFPLNPKSRLFVGGTNLSPIRYYLLWEQASAQCNPHEFVQSHIGERRLPPDHTHYGTPFLRPSAYKARVGGVSPRYEIEQICEGGIDSSTHSQSEQYLIGERFVPPTKRRILGFKGKPPLSPFVGLCVTRRSALPQHAKPRSHSCSLHVQQ